LLLLQHGGPTKSNSPGPKGVRGISRRSAAKLRTVDAEPTVSRDRSVPEATARLQTGMIARAWGSGRVAAWTAPHEPDDVPQLTRGELRLNFVNAPLMQQINRRYHRLGHTFNGCPSYRRIVENESERIAHGENISCQQTRCITQDASASTPKGFTPALTERTMGPTTRPKIRNFSGTCFA
jgi:hypothetical protein